MPSRRDHRHRYRRIASLKTVSEFRSYVAKLGIDLMLDDELLVGKGSPLARPYRLPDGFTIGNRFCVQPLEGWDGTLDGKPTPLTFRRWRSFGRSGAKLIWGGEAVAVQHDGRGTPNGLLMCKDKSPALADLRAALAEAHEQRFGHSDDLLIGLQLTHSGRRARPNRHDLREPCILYHHPLLDRRFGISADYPVMTDNEIAAIIARFIDAAEMAHHAGFGFVDIKHCHGYLGHEFLTARTRLGPFGGSFENRTRFFWQVVAGIRQRVPDLRIGVRLSAFDIIPTGPATNNGPMELRGRCANPPGDGTALSLCINLDETERFMAKLQESGVMLVNLSMGHPYRNRHILSPAFFPHSHVPSPPEDPLVSVARQMAVCASLKHRFQKLLIVGSAYSYLQEWLAHVAQHNVRTGRVDFVGLGRMLLAYPEFPADVLAGRPLSRKRLCRTCGDCSTAAHHGLATGCYLLDPFYRARPERIQLDTIKSQSSRA